MTAPTPRPMVTRRWFFGLLGVGAVATGLALEATTASAPVALPLRERVRIGAYVHLADHPHEDPVSPANLQVIEAGIGSKLDIIHYFWSWGRPFSQAVTGNVSTRTLMLSWQLDGATLANMTGETAYLDRFAADAKAHGSLVYVRVAWEMNGSWMSYSSAGGGPSADSFIAAWRFMVNRVRASADNIRFIWCPNEQDHPDRPGNRMEDYWPGSAWVDVLGFDAYNWGSQQPARGDGSWRPFRSLVQGPYERLAALDATKPVWLCEWGTTEAHTPPDPIGVSKAQWFLDASAITDFPQLTALIYFSERDDTNIQRDWRLDSSPTSLKGFKAAWS